MGGSIAGAKTEEAFDKSGIYEAVAGSAKCTCAGSKGEFYKSFDAQVRGKSNFHTEWDFMNGVSRDIVGIVPPLHDCGLHIFFSSYAGNDTELVTELTSVRRCSAFREAKSR